MAVLVVAATTAFGWRGTHHTDDAARQAARVSATQSATKLPASKAPATTLPTAGDQASPIPTVTSPTAGNTAAAGRLTLSVSARRSCPRAATACVDLSAHLTWLQSDGTITYGPVRMEPGPPGTANATPRGTFHVSWKAGVNYMSTEYHEPMPYAVFFAPGGVAFHGGSLTKPSHGCVHLSLDNARYYNDHLPVGAEVVVF
jgi:lipoprotein-anchoring transpeptidase ErfK/SrfK